MIVLRQKNYGIASDIIAYSHKVKNQLAVKDAVTESGKRKLDEKDKELVNRVKKRAGRYFPIANEQPLFGDGRDQFRSRSPRSEDMTKPIELVKRTGRRNANSKIRLIHEFPEVLAHEYGHGLNYAANGGYKRLVEYARAIKDKKNNVANLDKNRLVEEAKASRNGLNILKKEGATARQMRDARKRLKTAYKSYYETAKYNDSSRHKGDLRSYLNSKTRAEIDELYKNGLEKLDVGKSKTEKRLDRVADRNIIDKARRNLKCIGIKAARHIK